MQKEKFGIVLSQKNCESREWNGLRMYINKYLRRITSYYGDEDV